MQHTLDYNGITFEVEIIPYKECFSFGLRGLSEETAEPEMLTIRPSSCYTASSWIVLDVEEFPDIENSLIDAGIIEPEIITVIDYNFENYPVYELSDDAIALKK